MPFRHVMIFEIDESAEKFEVDRAFQHAGELLRSIPGVFNQSGGPTVNPFADVRRYGMMVEFRTLDDFRFYVTHSNHKAAINAIRPYNKSAMNVMLEI